MRHEHVNSATEILDVLRYFFGDIRMERFPLRSAHLSFYTCVTASQPNRTRCQVFCQNRRVLLDSASPNLSRKISQDSLPPHAPATRRKFTMTRM
jgi:hypothetical protein